MDSIHDVPLSNEYISFMNCMKSCVLMLDTSVELFSIVSVVCDAAVSEVNISQYLMDYLTNLSLV